MHALQEEEKPDMDHFKEAIIMIRPNRRMQHLFSILPGFLEVWGSLDEAGRAWMNEFMMLPDESKIEVLARLALASYGENGSMN